MEKATSLIKGMDMFGHAFELNFSGVGKYNTVLGGICSAPVYMFMIAYIIMLTLRIDNEKYDMKSTNITSYESYQ